MPTIDELLGNSPDEPQRPAGGGTIDDLLGQQAAPPETPENDLTDVEANDFFGRETLGQIAAFLLSPSSDKTPDVLGGRKILKSLGFSEEETQSLRQRGLGNVGSLVVGGEVIGPLNKLGAAAIRRVAPGLLKNAVGRAAARVAAGGVSGAAAGVVDAAVESGLAGRSRQEIVDDIANRAMFGGLLGGMFSFLAEGGKAFAKLRGKEPPVPTIEQIGALTEDLGRVTQKIDDVLKSGRAEAEQTVLSEAVARHARKALEAGDQAGAGLGMHNAEAILEDVQKRMGEYRVTGDDIRAVNETLRSTLRDGLDRPWNETLDKQREFWAAVDTIKRRWISDLEAYLSRDPQFGSVGGPAARLLQMSKQIEDVFVGHADDYFRPLLEPLGRKDLKLADEIIRGEALETGASKEVMALVDGWRKFAEKVHFSRLNLGVEQINLSTGKVTGALERQNFAPIFYPERIRKQILKKGTEQNAAAIARVKSIQAAHGMGEITDEAAQEFLKDMLNKDMRNWRPDIRAQSLQFSREFELPGFERNPRHWIHIYSRVAGERLAWARTFGGKDELMHGLIEQLRKEGAPAQAVDNLTAILHAAAGTGLEPASGIARMARNVMTYGFLRPSTAALQMTQLLPAFSEFGGKSLLRGFARYAFDPEARRWLERSGALTPSAIDPELMGKFANFYLKWMTFIKPVDRAIRGGSAIAAMLHAQEVASRYYKMRNVTPGVRQLLTGSAPKKLERALERMGLSPEDVMRTGGKLTDGQILLAGREGGRLTQFTSELLDIPLGATTNMGRLVHGLRKFSLQAGKWFRRSVWEEAKAGNWRPMARFTLALPAMTVFQNYLRAKIQGKELDSPTWEAMQQIYGDRQIPDNLDEVALDMFSLGMIGWYGDVIRNGTYGPTAIAAGVVGPAVQWAGTASYAAGEFVTGNPTSALERMLKITPVTNALSPEQQQAIADAATGQ